MNIFLQSEPIFFMLSQEKKVENSFEEEENEHEEKLPNVNNHIFSFTIFFVYSHYISTNIYKSNIYAYQKFILVFLMKIFMTNNIHCILFYNYRFKSTTAVPL